MASYVNLDDILEFIYKAFDFRDDGVSSLLSVPGGNVGSGIGRFSANHNVVVISDKPCDLPNDGITIKDGPFYRSIPFSSDFTLAVSSHGVIEAPALQFKLCGFGKYGPNSMICRESALSEFCLSSASRFAAVLLTRDFVLGDKFSKIKVWAKASGARECIRISFDLEALSGFDQPMMLVCWHLGRSSKGGKALWSRASSVKELEGALEDWRRSSWWAAVSEEWKRIDISGGCELPEDVFRDEPNFVDLYSRKEPEQLKLRVCVDGSGGSLRLICENNKSLLFLGVLKNELGTKVDNISKKDVPVLDFRLRARWLSENENGLDWLVDILLKSGFDVEVDDQVHGWLRTNSGRVNREKVPIEQFIETGDGWTEIHSDDGVRSECAELYNYWRDKIDKDLPWPFWDFQVKDLSRLLCKPDCMYAAFMGAGKSRMTLSYIQMRSGKRNLVVLQSRLIGEFIDEAEKIGFPISDIHVIKSASDANPENLKRVNIISYSRIWRPVDNRVRCSTDSERPCKTIAHILRVTRFNSLIFDEAHHLKGGIGTKQAEYSLLIRAKHVVCMSGTLARNYPKDLFALIVRTFGESTTSSRWAYRVPIEHDKPEICTSGFRVFSHHFTERTQVTSQYDNSKGATQGRELPTVPSESIEYWREMLQCKIVRRKRLEPEVLRDIPLPVADYQEIEFEITKDHAEFYLWWLESYFEWLESELERQHSSGGNYNINNGAVLAQLNKLQFASTIPQSEKVNISNTYNDFSINWSGGLTSKQAGVLESVEESIYSGEKVIVFSKRPELLELFSSELKSRGIRSGIIKGDMTMSKRDENKKKFKSKNGPPVLLMTLGSGNTGYNLPEADTLWLCDYDWVSSTMEQAAARILRSDWLTEERKRLGKQPKIRQAVQMGTIDEYMRQLVNFKSEGINQAMDRQDVEFDVDNWLSYKDFSIRMFRELGFKI